MGLCPDCSEEGETVSYIGASKADVVEGVEPEDEDDEDEEPSDDGLETEVCDLCEEEYVVDGEGE